MHRKSVVNSSLDCYTVSVADAGIVTESKIADNDIAGSVENLNIAAKSGIWTNANNGFIWAEIYSIDVEISINIDNGRRSAGYSGDKIFCGSNDDGRCISAACSAVRIIVVDIIGIAGKRSISCRRVFKCLRCRNMAK